MSEGEKQNIEQNELTEQQKRLKDLIFQSFRFSQGSPNSQSAILRWLGAKGYLATIDVPEKIPDYIQEVAIPRKHMSVPDDMRIKEMGLLWVRLRTAKSQSQEYPSNDYLKPILFGMIDKDTKFQAYERPNRQIGGEIVPDSSYDPHASFIRKYIINGHTSGNDAFDELFRELQPKVTLYKTAEPRYEDNSAEAQELKAGAIQLSMLVDYWQRRHPGHTFFPPEQSPSESAH